jgi:broad specificity phosphatase PhoE
MTMPHPRLIAAFIRHGDYRQLPQTPSAHQPFPLTEAGEQQARALPPALLELSAERAWSIHPVIDASRLLRGWQTARLIAGGLSGQCQVEGFDALAERGMGSAANLSIAQIETILDEDPRFDLPPANWKADSHYQLPLQGAESLLQAGERVAGHVRQRMAELSTQTSRDCLKLFVGHGAAFRHAAYHLGVLEFEQIARLSMYHCKPLCIELLANGKWRQVAGEWKQRAFADNQMD